ncbi:bola-like protein [Acaromyces ingoldii]|uniref:Bola-like protein n=1 Tax=Acaromyces ingoldii TaxID=215250 RepID=A0A316YXN6_9BASI|nr:bola-like protein [Acaromyces ingoldii]PWN94019.1 bola-like protein [Acaromyces ingoldii]
MVAPIRRPFSTSATRRQEAQETEEKTEMDSGEQDIHDILTKKFQPKQLQVQDVSGGCGSFYAIAIQSSAFKGLTTVKAHRLVNEALKDVIAGIHGLQLRTIPADD